MIIRTEKNKPLMENTQTHLTRNGFQIREGGREGLGQLEKVKGAPTLGNREPFQTSSVHTEEPTPREGANHT